MNGRALVLSGTVVLGMVASACKNEPKKSTTEASPNHEPQSANALADKTFSIKLLDKKSIPLAQVEIFDKNNTPLGESDSSGQATLSVDPNTELLFIAEHIVNSKVSFTSQNLRPYVVSIERKHKILIDIENTTKGAEPIAFVARGTSGNRFEYSFPLNSPMPYTWLPEGHYQTWLHGNHLLSEVQPIQVSSDKTLGYTLYKGFSVQGKIVGKSIPSSGTVGIFRKDSKYPAKRTEIKADRTFKLDGVPSGTWTSTLFSSSHYNANDADFSVAKNLSGMHIDAIPKHQVTGRVLDSKGNPIENVRVFIPGKDALPMVSKEPMPWTYPIAGDKKTLKLSPSRSFGAFRPGKRPLECLKGHCGIDIGSTKGQGILAAASGKVIKLSKKNTGLAGKFIKIDHDGVFTTWYIHLDSLSPQISVGTKVTAGEKIGTLGDTGIKRSKPHLHFGVAANHGGQLFYIDPLNVLRDSLRKTEIETIASEHQGQVIASSPIEKNTEPTRLTTDGYIHSTHTDTSGLFSLSGVEDKKPTIYFDHPQFVRSFRKLSLTAQRHDIDKTTLIALQRRKGNIELPQTANVSFTIHAEWGSEDAISETGPQVIQSNGDFSLDVPPIPYDLVLYKGKHEHQRFLIRDKNVDFFALVAHEKNQRLRLKIIDESGLIANDAMVKRMQRSEAIATYTTDRDGHITIDNLGEEKLTFVINAPWSFQKSIHLSPSESWQEVVLSFGVTLDIPLRLENGDPPAQGTLFTLKKGSKTKSCRSNNDGSCRISGLEPGNWTFAAKDPRFVKSPIPITIPKAKTRNQTFRGPVFSLSEGVTVSGIIRDDLGNRLSNATIQIGNEVTKTDLDGYYKFKAIRYGTHQLTISKDKLVLSQRVAIEPGNPHRKMDWKLVP